MKKISSMIILMMLSIMVFSFNNVSIAAMSYEQALLYQKNYDNDIVLKYEKVQDIYGKNQKKCYLGFLGKRGVYNDSGFGSDATMIDFRICYGYENSIEEPYPVIVWLAELGGLPEKGFEPKQIHVAFSNGVVKDIDLQGWSFEILNNAWGRYFRYTGTIKMNNIDLYDIYSNGEVVSVSIDNGNEIKNFFYTGNKQQKEKDKLNRGIKYAIEILDINEKLIEQQRILIKEQAKKEREEKMRKEIEAELEYELEKEALKKKILAEKNI